MKKYLDGHTGDLILWSTFVLCLTAHTVTVLLGKTDQTLAGAVLGTLGALGAYMQKRATTTTTTNVEAQKIEKVETKPESGKSDGTSE